MPRETALKWICLACHDFMKEEKDNYARRSTKFLNRRPAGTSSASEPKPQHMKAKISLPPLHDS